MTRADRPRFLYLAVFSLILPIFSAGVTRAASTFSVTYDLPDTLTIIGSSTGTFTFGVSGPVIDHQFDGEVIHVDRISVTAAGNAVGERVNFDWNTWINNGPLSLTVGGSQTSSDDLNAITTPSSYSTGLHITDGNTVLGSTGPFALSMSYNFLTASATATPGFGSVPLAVSNHIAPNDGLYLEVAAWSGDISASAPTVDFTMSSISVTLDGTIIGQPESVSVPTLSRTFLVVLTLLLAAAGILACRKAC